MPVPAVTVVAADSEVPAEIAPVVEAEAADRVVPAAIAPVVEIEAADRVVVAWMDPGATKAAGTLKVTVFPALATETCPAVPARVMLPPTGTKPLTVFTAPAVPPRTDQVSVVLDLATSMKVVPAKRFIHIVLTGSPELVEGGLAERIRQLHGWSH
jgi:hypothetical protein